VGEQQQPLLGRRIETGDEVPQRKRVLAGSDVLPALHDHGVCPLAKQAVKPVCRLPVCLGARHPGTKADLRLDVAQRSVPLELLRWAGLFLTGENGDDGDGGEGGAGGESCFSGHAET
jgi:hypothetical protein